MTLPASEPIPPVEEPGVKFPRRRRAARPHRLELEEERSRLGSLASLLAPSIDYYFGFFLAGLLAGVAMLIDAPALYLLAVLFAPFLGPVFGLPFSGLLGSIKFLLRSFAHLIGGGIIVFAMGVLAGWIAANMAEGSHFNQTHLHSVFSWPDLFVLVVGAGFTTYLLVRSPRQKPLVANIAVAYELALPLAVSGFYLSNTALGSWTAALVVFGVHLTIAVLVSGIMLLVLGMRPVRFFGYALTITFIVLGIAAAIFAAGQGQAPPSPTPIETPTAPTAGATSTLSPELSSTPQPAQTSGAVAPLSTATSTIEPSITPTATVTFAPTPVWAKIDAPSGGGAFIRVEPDGKIITSLLNGSPVTIISEPLRAQNGAIWVQVRTETGVEGWVLQSLLATATPSPGW